MSILSTIKSPTDLKKLTLEQLPQLAHEMREFLIDSVSQTGGHLAPSLGVIELTIMMHYLFSTPKDKFIWDVGHQAYPHKMITGRTDLFHTLRKYNGISGFPHITESEHDALTVGHASTSISGALGYARARDIRGGDENVLAVIGDGALTGGLAFEALNNLGHSSTKMTVILNDNEMSIAPNVGGVSKYLTKIITDKKFNKLKDNIWNMLEKMPKVGKPIQSAVHNLEEAAMRVITPGKFFEDMGISYIGPVDGHNYEELMAVLKYARDESRGPLLIHVLTQKGKGYHPAENNKAKFHGIGSFHKDTGEVKTGSGPAHKSYSACFGDALCKLAANDKTIAAVTAAMPDGTGLSGFRDQYPDRFFDVGIAEGHAVTFSAGLALNGVKPVVAVYSTFLQRAYDHMIHDVALENLNVVFAIDRAGVVGNDGPTHHGCLDMTYLRSIPNMTVLAPSNGTELQEMLYAALYKIDGPVAIRFPRGNVPEAQLPSDYSTAGASFEPKELTAGTKTVLLSAGHFLPIVEGTHAVLKKAGIETALWDARTVKPLSLSAYKQLFSDFDTIVTFEQNTIRGGFGAAVLEVAAALYEAGEISSIPKILPIGYPDEFITQGSMDELMVDIDFTPELLAARIQNYLKK